MWNQALARAPAGRLPEATKQRGAAARAAGEIQLGAFIPSAAGALLQLLSEVGCQAVRSLCPAVLRLLLVPGIMTRSR